MLKVLHYIPGFLYGGIESMFIEWYKNIDKTNFQFELLIRTQNENAHALMKYKSLDGNYYRLSQIQDLHKYINSVKNFFQEHHDYDILHAHGMDPIVFKYAKKYGVKTIVAHSHNADIANTIKENMKHYIGRYSIKKYADYAFSCSKKASLFKFKGQQFKGNPVYIINNAINLQDFCFNKKIRNKIRTKLSIDNSFVVGHVGRLTYQKNQYFLLDIFKEVINKFENSVLMLIGDGYEQKGLKEYSVKLGIDNKVLFFGEINKVSEYMQAMDCFVLPSRWEGLPVTLIEAQAAGLPCFVSEEVTKEADLITSLIFRNSIKDKPKNWANDIFSQTNYIKRYVTKQKIIEAGYDMKTEVRKLENIYKTIVKEQ